VWSGDDMREIEEHKQTGNMSLFNKLIKRVRANKGDISCSYCPYNKKENSSYKKDRSWKKYRKSQFKGGYMSSRKDRSYKRSQDRISELTGKLNGVISLLEEWCAVCRAHLIPQGLADKDCKGCHIYNFLTINSLTKEEM
jgi:hypothetical protein